MVAKYLETLAAACVEPGDFARRSKWQTKANERPDDPARKEPRRNAIKLYQERSPTATPGLDDSSFALVSRHFLPLWAVSFEIHGHHPREIPEIR